MERVWTRGRGRACPPQPCSFADNGQRRQHAPVKAGRRVKARPDGVLLRGVFPAPWLAARSRRWCERGDSNPHALRHWNLNPGRLPIPPLSRFLRSHCCRTGCKPEASRAAGWAGNRLSSALGFVGMSSLLPAASVRAPYRAAGPWANVPRPPPVATASSLSLPRGPPPATGLGLRYAVGETRLFRGWEIGKKKATWRTRWLLSWWAVKDSNLGPID